MTEISIIEHIKDDVLNVLVKPSAPKTESLGWDEDRQVLRIAVSAVPDKDKANAELIKFLRKSTGKSCKIRSGLKSRKKTVEFY